MSNPRDIYGEIAKVGQRIQEIEEEYHFVYFISTTHDDSPKPKDMPLEIWNEYSELCKKREQLDKQDCNK